MGVKGRSFSSKGGPKYVGVINFSPKIGGHKINIHTKIYFFISDVVHVFNNSP